MHPSKKLILIVDVQLRIVVHRAFVLIAVLCASTTSSFMSILAKALVILHICDTANCRKVCKLIGDCRVLFTPDCILLFTPDCVLLFTPEYKLQLFLCSGIAPFFEYAFEW